MIARVGVADNLLDFLHLTLGKPATPRRRTDLRNLPFQRPGIRRGSLAGFLSRTLDGSLKALAWVGATAIIWVPLVILLTLFWRRLTPKAPSE